MSKPDDKKIDLCYKFKEGDTVNYEFNKTITEKIISNKELLVHSKKTFKTNIEHKIIHIAPRGIITINIKNDNMTRQVNVDRKGNTEYSNSLL